MTWELGLIRKPGESDAQYQLRAANAEIGLLRALLAKEARASEEARATITRLEGAARELGHKADASRPCPLCAALSAYESSVSPATKEGR